jgi:putative spermidine/putrescine transport system ATP-binding protein
MLAATLSAGVTPGMRARGIIRAEQIRIARQADALSGCETTCTGTVSDVIFEGERLLYLVQVPALSLTMQVYHHDPASHAVFRMGEPVTLGWRAGDMMVFEAGTREGPSS